MCVCYPLALTMVGISVLVRVAPDIRVVNTPIAICNFLLPPQMNEQIMLLANPNTLVTCAVFRFPETAKCLKFFIVASLRYLGGMPWSRMGPRNRVQGGEGQGRNEVFYKARPVIQVSLQGGWDGMDRKRGEQGCGVPSATSLLHEGQRESGALLTLCRKLLRKEQYPEWSWESVEQRQRGRSISSSATAGGEL